MFQWNLLHFFRFYPTLLLNTHCWAVAIVITEIDTNVLWRNGILHGTGNQTGTTYWIWKYRLVMGSFHLIKRVLKCMGNYPAGIGAEHIWLESGMIGPTIIKNWFLMQDIIIAHSLGLFTGQKDCSVWIQRIQPHKICWLIMCPFKAQEGSCRKEWELSQHLLSSNSTSQLV